MVEIEENIYIYAATIMTKSEVQGQSWSQLTIRTDARSECYCLNVRMLTNFASTININVNGCEVNCRVRLDRWYICNEMKGNKLNLME